MQMKLNEKARISLSQTKPTEMKVLTDLGRGALVCIAYNPEAFFLASKYQREEEVRCFTFIG